MNRRLGFSLIEVLVAVALLAIIGILLAQMTSAMTRAIKISNQAVDAAAQARLAFDRIGMDLGSAVVRSDTDFSATNTTNNNFLTFISTVPSASPTANFTNRGISLVAYRFATNTTKQYTNVSLFRVGKAIGWTPDFTGFMGITTNGYPVKFFDTAAGFPSALNIASSDYDVLAPAVLNAVIGFQLYPDGDSVKLADGSIVPAQGQVVYSPPMRGTNAPADTYVDPQRISSLVVGLVVVDPDKLKLLTPETAGYLATKFDLTPAELANTNLALPVAKWMNKTANLAADSLDDRVPLAVRQTVRVYQRFFPITPFQAY